MVKTIVLAGVARSWVPVDEFTVVATMVGAEALDALSRRACDAIAIGSVPDLTQADLIERIHARHPLLPIVVVGEQPAGEAGARVWECLPPNAVDRLSDAIGRACEVGRLRRECDRLGRGAPREEPRAVEATFERGSIREMERLMIEGRLARLNQNRTRSAESLDISVRTLRNKLREYRGEAPRVAEGSAQHGLVEQSSLTD